VAETFDENGERAEISTTETTTTLESVDDRGVTLRTDVTLKIAGKQFDSPSRSVRKGFHGDVNGETAQVATDGTGHVTIGDQRFPCQIRRVTITGDSSKRVSTVYFSDRVAPFELRRETVCTDLEEKKLNYQTSGTVTAISLPYKVLTEIQTVAFVKTVHTSSKGKTITVEVHCSRVPGGVVAHWSKQLDESGRVVRRSVLELLDYGIAGRNTAPPRTGRIVSPRRARRIDARSR
jgi:hypothetical protein